MMKANLEYLELSNGVYFEGKYRRSNTRKDKKDNKVCCVLLSYLPNSDTCYLSYMELSKIRECEYSIYSAVRYTTDTGSMCITISMFDK